MNINIKIFLLCPIPEDQKPINEYISLKKNSFTNWIKFSKNKYRNKLINLFSFFLFIFTLLQVKILQTNLLNILVLKNILVLSSVFVSIILITSQVLWQKVAKRLNLARIFYEEASWFDGQIWEKPFLILKNDRLLKVKKVQPNIKRLQITIIQFVLIICFLLIFN